MKKFLKDRGTIDGKETSIIGVLEHFGKAFIGILDQALVSSNGKAQHKGPARRPTSH